MMEIFDWSIVKNKIGEGSFTLEFEVSKGNEDVIRHMLNGRIKQLQDELMENRRLAE